ncbi:O-acetyltransferase [Bacteroidia bacterium]|nr:O-acetyltransferase [Bacteroidia bacterium]GHT65481.1 O-acetyltransferase [Bacteroidia bacterium]
MFLTYLKELVRPKRLLTIIRHILLTKKYKGKKIIIGLNTAIVNTMLEEHVFIGSNSSIINAHIGKHSYVSSSVRISNVNIGSFTSIGSDVIINIGSHPTYMVSTHPAFYANNKIYETFSDKLYVQEYYKITIQNDVWIGSHATIIGNVTIGNGAIIAFGAVVTKDVPPYSIVGGVPAKIIKYRFEVVIIKKLEEIRWWEFSDDFLKQKFMLFHNVNDFIEYYDSHSNIIESFRKK